MPPDPRDILDLSNAPAAEGGGARPTGQEREGAAGRRPFLSLYFGCANAYGRAYKRADGSCYEGRCPKCGKTIEFPVGDGGTRRRMFEVRCDGI